MRLSYFDTIDELKHSFISGLKCKTNLFGVDPSPEIKVRPLEVTDVPQKKENSKIWSITDILNTK